MAEEEEEVDDVLSYEVRACYCIMLAPACSHSTLCSRFSPNCCQIDFDALVVLASAKNRNMVDIMFQQVFRSRRQPSLTEKQSGQISSALAVDEEELPVVRTDCSRSTSPPPPPLFFSFL